MARNNFDASLAKLLVHEGGYVNHPADPGGATNMGITHLTLAAWRGVARVTPQQVKMLTLAEAAKIYRRQYWDAAKCDDLPAGLDYAVFDMGVHSGVGRSVRYLQTVLKRHGLYDGAIDGIIGAKSLQGIRSTNDLAGLISEFIADRLKFLKRLKGWSSFGRGWQRRIDEVLATSLQMSRGAVSAQPVRPTQVSDCRTPHDRPGACDVSVTKTAEGQGAGAVGVGAAGAALSEAAQHLEPIAHFSETIRWVFVALLVAGIGFTLYTNLRRVKTQNAEAA